MPNGDKKGWLAEDAVKAMLRSFGESPDFDLSLGVCMDTLANLADVSAVAVFQLVEADAELRLVSSRGFTDSAVANASRLPLDGTLSGLTLRHQRIITSLDVAHELRILPSIRAEMTRQRNQMIVSVPLILYRQAVGVMNLIWNESRQLTAAETDGLSYLGFGMAVALDHTRRDFEARHDALTGLPNRREFERRLAEWANVRGRYGNTFSMVMLDVDHFKRINDDYGHQAGDGVLKSLARLLRERLRKADSCCRYGGEEFIFLMPETHSPQAVTVAEDIRSRFAALPQSERGESFTCSLSAGVAESAGESPRDLLARADEALYSAKAAGRNRVAVAPPAAGASAGNGTG